MPSPAASRSIQDEDAPIWPCRCDANCLAWELAAACSIKNEE